jgi:PAS domain S-box-containing protein
LRETIVDTVSLDRGEDVARGRLEALSALAAAVSRSPDLEGALQRAVEAVLALFDIPTGILRRLHPPTGELSVAAHVGVPAAFQAELVTTTRADEAPVGLAVRQRALVIIDDLASSPYADSSWARCGYRTFVAVPLLCRDMLVGSLNLAVPQLRAFDAADRELLTAAAHLIAVAIANHELYAATQRKVHYLSVLHQCGQDLGPAPDEVRVLQLATERMARLLGLARTALFLWCPATDELQGAAGYPAGAECVRAPRAGADLGRGGGGPTHPADWLDRPTSASLPKEMLGHRAPLADLPLAARVIREREVAVSSDPTGEGLLPPDLWIKGSLGPVLAVPLVAHDQVLGLLVGECNGASGGLSPDEIELAMIFAQQVAVWITSSRLLLKERESRARAEAAEARFRALLESAPDGMVIVDADGRIVLLNSQAEKLFGYAREELLGKEVEVLMPESVRREHVVRRTDYVRAPRVRPMGVGLELFARRKGGEAFPVEVSLSPLQQQEGVLITSVIRDITERKRTDQERARLLESEREKSEQLKLAIREAHHRIKNNLQAVSDLLYLEMSAGDGMASDGVDHAAESPLRDSIDRIQAIAAVHDLLSQEADVRVVDAGAVIRRLVPQILQSSGLSTDVLSVTVEVPSIALSSKRATVLALILNELVSNAARHAFARGSGRAPHVLADPGGRADQPSGELIVSLRQESEELVLRVQDDGPGLPPGFRLDTHSHVGLDVVRTLAERDLDGRLTFLGQGGVTAEVRFAW